MALALWPMTLRLRAEEWRPRVIAAEASEREVKALWHSLTPGPNDDPPGQPPFRDWQMVMTPWLPSEWPPTPTTRWTRYGYGHDVTLDGVVGVSSPFLSVERRAGKDAQRVLTPLVRKLKTVGTLAVRPRPGPGISAEEGRRVQAYVVMLVGPPADPQAVRRYYREWIGVDAVIAREVEGRHAKFFGWVGR